MFQTKVIEEIETFCVQYLVLANRPIYEIMWKKYCRAGQATNDNMTHAHCMLDTYGYKYTLRLFNAYCFSTAAVAARTRLNVTLYYIASLVCIMSLYRYMNSTSSV